MPDAFPAANRDRALGIIEKVLGSVWVPIETAGIVLVVLVFLPGMLLQPEAGADGVRGADKSATSLGHAVQICLDLHHEATQP